MTAKKANPQKVGRYTPEKIVLDIPQRLTNASSRQPLPLEIIRNMTYRSAR